MSAPGQGPIAPPQSLEDEQSVLGAVLLSDTTLPAITLDVGLRPEHFYRTSHGEIFAAMLALSDRNEPVDALTVLAELKRRGMMEAVGGPAAVELLAGSVPAVGNVRAYATRVLELAELRQYLHGAYGVISACHAEDRDELAEALGLFNVERPGRVEITAEALVDELFEFMQGGEVETWPTPWETLTRLMAGGFRRGETTVLSGHSSHGKSVVGGQFTETVAAEFLRRGAGKVRVYVSEGSCRNWGLRFVARRATLNYGRLVQGKLREGEHARYCEALEWWRKLGIVLVPAHGWKPEDIARDVKRHRPDFWAVDLFNELDVGRGETYDWDRAVRTLTAVPEQTESHLLLLAHVNESRSSGKAERPKPTLGDLRSTGMLKNAADNVIFVWREQDPDGEPLDDAEVYVRKARDAQLGTLEVTFQGKHQRFLARGEG